MNCTRYAILCGGARAVLMPPNSFSDTAQIIPRIGVKMYLREIIYSPLNYIGGKQKILPQLLPIFPKNINICVDLFAGGCNIGLNIPATKLYCNDNLIYLIELYKIFQTTDISEILSYIETQIKDFNLSLENKEGFNLFRQQYNEQKKPLDLFILAAFAFNHQIRFNSSHEFNTPFGYQRSHFNNMMKKKLVAFINRIQESNIIFSHHDFEFFDFSNLNNHDFVYCDPPYLVTTATYNDGKRGFTGWNNNQEKKLLQLLCKLHQQKIKFALSNVIEHKGKVNNILVDWIKDNPYLIVNHITSNYSNSNYQTFVRDKQSSYEVLITNYQHEDVNILF